MTDESPSPETRRGPASLKESPEADEPQDAVSESTTAKQEKIDADRAARSGSPGTISHTVDNALAGAAVAAAEKDARAKVRNG